jgi:hypothetical protein
MNPVMLTRPALVAALFWCRSKIGVNTFNQKPPRLRVVKASGKVFGKYDFEKNLITIYLGNHGSIIQTLNTLIHEYAHACLQPTHSTYNDLTEYFGYENHPLEKDAIALAKKYQFPLYKYLLELDLIS